MRSDIILDILVQRIQASIEIKIDFHNPFTAVNYMNNDRLESPFH